MTFDFISKTITPKEAESKKDRQLSEDYLNWLPEHFLNHNGDLTKLEELQITIRADLNKAITPKRMSNSKAFTVHALTKSEVEKKPAK